ncbi:MAG TPA: TRAP transporter substrate-binding protein [Stellaceae bacterium]|nr:TRAP transporter substrate-binding protein [Stellaceae bacterium]
MQKRPSAFQPVARRRLLAASLAAGIIGAPAIVRAQATRSLRFGTPVPPDSTYGKAVAMFADELAKLSGNKIKIDIYPNSQLGSIKDMLTAVQLGTLSMAIAVPAWFAGFAKQMDVFSLPFLVSSQERLRTALDGAFGARMAGFAGDAGFKLLGWLIMGPRQMANNLRPVHGPADLAGMKVRVISSPVFLKTFQLLGANPVGLDSAEMYLALQQHTVDGVENSSVDIVNLKLYEVSKYFSSTAHIMDLFGVAMNKALWESFTPDEQGMAQQAMKTAMDWEWKTQPETTTAAVEKIKAAMQVNDLEPAEREKFVAATRPVYQQFEASIGKDLIAQAIHELGPA